jgi:polysaccharide export outer membrane protein
VALAFACLFALGGCALLPGQGPSSMDIALLDDTESETPRNYTIVNLDASTVNKLGPQRPASLSNEFSDRIHGKTSIVIGIGDILIINVWEASPDGLFSTTEQKQISIEVIVDEDGHIYIPYVGHIDVVGMSVEEVRQSVEAGLLGKAVEPQVQINLTSYGEHKATVIGAVARPGQYDITVNGLRLIEAIAQAGGGTQASFETGVTIVRGDVNSTIHLDEVVRLPSNNVWLMPGDTVEVARKPRSFTAFGAVTSKNQIPFVTETVSLAEALAQSGGINDNLADAGGIFLFRFETPARLGSADVQLPNVLFEGEAATIYRLDLTEPEAFFLARSFMMQDKDLIYVANAPAAEFRKFVANIVAPFLGVARANTIIGDSFN